MRTGPNDRACTEAEPSLGRRGFLGALGASLALMGSEGCRRSVERIVPYATSPERIIPGVPLHFATAYARRGDSVGLVVESHEGRPTKIEGNPLHPSSLGAVDLITQASILDLYDPDRSPAPTRGGAKSTWETFDGELKARLASFAKDGGARLRVLTEPLNSPTLLRLRAALLTRFPKAHVHTYSPVDDGNARAGTSLAFGRPLQTLVAYDRARVIVALDADFLQTEPGNVRAHKLFSAGRRLASSADTMSRLYVVEPALTTTGGAADHRLRLPASQVRAYALLLARELAILGAPLGELGQIDSPDGRGGEGIPRPWLAAVARDLLSNRGASAVVVGTRQPPEVHALAHAINEALGNRGETVTYGPIADPDDIGGTRSIQELSEALEAGSVDTLVIVGGNPAYDAPADLRFAEKLRKAPFAAHLSAFQDETSGQCAWHLPRAHELEAWGDQRALDGTVAVQQPLMLPLFDARSDVELFASLSASEDVTPYDLVRATLRTSLLESRGMSSCAASEGSKIVCGTGIYPVLAFEHDWKKSLRDGILGRSGATQAGPALRVESVVRALSGGVTSPPPSRDALEVVFAVDAKMLDGRHANNSWLQELSDPVTAISWDNAALLSTATAKELAVESGDVLRLSLGGQSIHVAAWVLPGTADATIALSLGWGRKRAGRIGSGRGFDVYPLRTSGAMHVASGVSVARTGKRHEFARTQRHSSEEGRPLAREATLSEYRAKPHFAELQSPPKRSLPMWTDVDYGKGYQWGMSIDLNACTGCNACVVACQAENNIPVVGKEQVVLGRDMQWIRMARYLTAGDEPEVAIQPVACVQCEEAPCENVCPVAALEHSAEGLSEITYNRCIGTRYCANNCPYKVRKFNYLNWHNDGVWKDTGGLPETLQMQQNPNVTVRFRGVVEKCTYCVQRIQAQRFVAKRERRDLRDGDVVTACQATCPADAIVFGDLNDMSSRVAKLTVSDRRYSLLEELGTKPRTTYLAKVRNLNPEMAR